MDKYTEKEIKILDIDPVIIEQKLEQLNAHKDFDTIQTIATYQFPTTKTRYMSLLNQLNEININKTNLKNKFKTFFEEMNNIVNDDDLTKICNYKNLKEYSENFTLEDKTLQSEDFINYISSLHKRFFKWIRLRTTNDKTTLTIKEIFSQEDEYPIDKLKEVEFEVSDFNFADKFLNEMDFYCDSHQEKRRIQYKLNNLEIAIDFWPMINPYIEIEGKNQEEIYDLVKKLGYNENDAVVMNTDSVYTRYGINRQDYCVLTFEKQVKTSE